MVALVVECVSLISVHVRPAPVLCHIAGNAAIIRPIPNRVSAILAANLFARIQVRGAIFMHCSSRLRGYVRQINKLSGKGYIRSCTIPRNKRMRIKRIVSAAAYRYRPCCRSNATAVPVYRARNSIRTTSHIISVPHGSLRHARSLGTALCCHKDQTISLSFRIPITSSRLTLHRG